MKRVDRTLLGQLLGQTEEGVRKMIEQEFLHLHYTNHPHVVRLFDFRQDARYAYFVMEAANGGDLKRLVAELYKKHDGKLSEPYVADILHQSLYALHYLHQDARIHKDVKTENLMLLSQEARRPHVVLIDLGLAEMVGDDERGPVPAGTLQTMAPEVIDTHLGRRPEGFDQRCDIYSLGVVAFELFTGKVPYEPVSRNDGSYDYAATRELVETVDVSETLVRQAGRSPGAVDLVRRMLSMDPNKRPTALECMRDEWLIGHIERRRRRQRKAEGMHSLSSLSSLNLSFDIPVTAEEAGERISQARRGAISMALMEFSNRSAQMRAAAYHLAANMPISQLARVTESFKRMDTDLSGDLSYSEMACVLMDALGVDEHDALYVASCIDMDRSGAVNFREFAAATTTLCQEREREVLGWVSAALEASGQDGLSFEEVRKVVEEASGGRIQHADVADWCRAAEHVLEGEALLDLCRHSSKISPQAFRQKFGWPIKGGPA
mmetsp:Transcript_84379/g.235414  ORF Transcript_84379/g.235414 Transcript_84379/m.235414 type:complete len:493 (-) Transcript_84379:81-1559(-)